MFRKLTCIGLVLVLSSIVSAADFYWNSSVSSGNWNVISNWKMGNVAGSPLATTLPNFGDQAWVRPSLNGNKTDITVNVTANANISRVNMNFQTMKLNIQSGVTLQNDGSLSPTAMQFYNTSGVCQINVYGTFRNERTDSTALGIKIGGGGTNSINIYNGGLLTAKDNLGTGLFGIGTVGSGGSSTVNIYDGGIIDVDAYIFGTNVTNSSLNFYGTGKMIVKGDVRTQVNTDIGAGKIFGNGTVGNVIAKYDGTKTTIHAPIPVTVEVFAGTSAGWDFYDIGTNISGGDAVDFDDIGVLAAHWLGNPCDDTNYWCGRADLDESSNVDFIDYALLAEDWLQPVADKILLQTIYGTAQDSAGNITANSYYTLNKNQGIAMAFKVPEHTAIDKAVLKCFNIAASNQLRIRLYDVNGLGFLTYGHTMTRTSPGSTGAKIIDFTSTLPTSIPSHTELGDGRNYTDLSLTFGPQEVNEGEYLLVLDANGPANTWGNLVRGSGSEPVAMGQYPEGTPLPKQATVTTDATTGNTYFYQLTGSADASYTPVSNLPAFQIMLNQAPSVNAGADQTIYDPANSVTLDATVTDDGLPQPPAITTRWTKLIGPGTVTFGDPNAVDTTAAFSDLGVYKLRLTASDGQIEGHDDIIVTVMPASGDTIIYHVTNLASSGAGSFSSFLTLANADGLPSKIVFDVGGTILTPSVKTLLEDNTIVYGFSSPPPGITFDFNHAASGFGISGNNCKFCNVTITRTSLDSDGIHITGNNNVVERCTLTLCRDEGVAIAQGTGNVIAFCLVEFCGSQPGDGSDGATGRGISISYAGSQATVVSNYVGDCLRGVLCGDYGTDIFGDFRHNLVTNTHSNYAFTVHANSFANYIQNTVTNNSSDGIKYQGICTYYRSGNILSNNSGGNQTYDGSGQTEVFTPITKPNTPFPSWLNSATTPASKNDVGRGTGDCISCQ